MTADQSNRPQGTNLSAFARKLQRRTNEPIAIVGVGCRFPGASDPEAFADALASGASGIREVPADRWDADAYFAPPGTPGTICTREGGFIDGVELFDAPFFGVSPREAVAMDPQQRLLLEVTWEALESAATTKSSIAGSKTGVFVGVSAHDYAHFVGERDVDGYTITGLSASVAAGRLSSFFDLRGPSEVIDTACSASLVAVHRACAGLRAGEIDAAFAGGVNVMLHPMVHIGFSQAGMLSRDGRCKTFDARADGYGRGEGCGVVFLKRLSDAQRDGDPIHAVVTGSAINHNGRGGGLTAPSGPAQQELVRSALHASGRDARAIDYVEAHGTGTPLGDPQELFALGSVLRERADADDRRVFVGSVKTNIGHLEAGAGIAALIKLVAMIRRGQIFPHVGLERVNPEIDLAALRLEIPTALRPWPLRDGVRVGGVSSFGFSGTNAHAIVESPPSGSVTPRDGGAPNDGGGDAPRFFVFTASTRSHASLLALAERWRTFLARTKESLAAACFTSNVGREVFEHRVAIVTSSIAHLRDALGDFVAGRVNSDVRASSLPLPASAPSRSSEWPTRAVAERVAAAWLDRAPCDFRELHGEATPPKVPAPTYPFERRPYWLGTRPGPRRARPPVPRVDEAATTGEVSSRQEVDHPLLGRRIASAAAVAQFESRLGAASPAELGGHRIYGLPLFPATGFIELAVAAARAVLGDVGVVLEELAFERALVLPESGVRCVQVVVTRAHDALRCEVFSKDASDDPSALWTRHASARVRSLGDDDAPPVPYAVAATIFGSDRVADAAAARTDAVDVDRHYRALADRGMAYTGAFRALSDLARGPRGSGLGHGRVVVAPAASYVVSPAALDACLQVIGPAVETKFAAGGGSRIAYLPIAAARVTVRRRADASLASLANVTLGAQGFEYAADVRVFSADGEPVCEIEGLQMRGVERARLATGEVGGDEGEILRAFAECPAERKRALVAGFVREQAAAVIGLDVSEIDDSLMFFEFGMSSLGSVELQYRLQKNLRCDLSGIALDYEGVETLSNALLERLSRNAGQAAISAAGGE